jgi:hypothetical protein
MSSAAGTATICHKKARRLMKLRLDVGSVGSLMVISV